MLIDSGPRLNLVCGVEIYQTSKPSPLINCHYIHLRQPLINNTIISPSPSIQSHSAELLLPYFRHNSRTNNVNTTPLLLPPHPPRTPHPRTLSPRQPLPNPSQHPFSILLLVTISLTTIIITIAIPLSILTNIARNNRTDRPVPPRAKKVYYPGGTV